ncbi:MAG: VOC family protein [Pseudomonadales bacterium]|jgi:catechol 2,3-dioxygenase-like lactoylglutathione lyase family enzyme|nr:VOC family protein [Pseudomonadales bacterium]MDP6472013.1 VOC family protein [Pseudomonadales bacterium]MDP6826714.1 VOC family protein [Pseudomonadales bacterium]MDP6972648.1 VOC family protein [Pseudomonadales bacterium]|tara:strand:- start:2651 stop:3202 length:552 start_codon:yes stop_codon:yes gene_type:complete
MPDSNTVQSKSVHHIAYATRDAEATYEFYTKKLGIPLLRTENHLHGDGYFRHFFFGIGSGEAIAFFEVEGVGEEPDFKTEISTGLGLPVWVNHIAFRLDTLEELDAMTERVRDAGIEDIQRIDHGWCTSIYMMDPNGIMTEFCVTTDADAFAQTEEEALRLMRLPANQITEETRKDGSLSELV